MRVCVCVNSFVDVRAHTHTLIRSFRVNNPAHKCTTGCTLFPSASVALHRPGPPHIKVCECGKRHGMVLAGWQRRGWGLLITYDISKTDSKRHSADRTGCGAMRCGVRRARWQRPHSRSLFARVINVARQCNMFGARECVIYEHAMNFWTSPASERVSSVRVNSNVCVFRGGRGVRGRGGFI